MTQADRELGMCCINRFLADWFNYSRLGYGQRLFLPTIEHICSNIYLIYTLNPQKCIMDFYHYIQYVYILVFIFNVYL